MRFNLVLGARVQFNPHIRSLSFWVDVFKMVSFGHMEYKVCSTFVIRSGCGWFCLGGSAKK